MKEETRALFVGIDWGEETCQVCVTDREGKVLKEWATEHSGDGFEKLFERLLEIASAPAEAVAVAIEMPRGALVEGLLERGFTVYSINPKQLDRFRDRYSPAGAKDDRRDAFVLAETLRTDGPLYRKLHQDDPTTIELRELSRLRDEIVEQRHRVTNRLRHQLHRFFPQVLELSPAADEPWIWALLKLVPTPRHVDGLSPRRLQRFLERHRIRRFDLLEVARILSTTPLPVAPGVTEAAHAHIKFLLPQLELLQQQLGECEAQIDVVFERIKSGEDEKQHRGVEILLSLPGIGRSVAATMLAEAAEPLARRDYSALRTLCGVAPVTRRSGKTMRGKKLGVFMRRACNRRLREATYHMARVHVQRDPLGRLRYDALRAKGHGHARALRGVADRLLKVITAMLRTGTPYRPPMPVSAPA